MQAHDSRCLNHSGLDERVSRSEDDIKVLYGRTNAMIAWVIGGMASMIGLFAVNVFDLIFK